MSIIINSYVVYSLRSVYIDMLVCYSTKGKNSSID
jgi:hypothetical protein